MYISRTYISVNRLISCLVGNLEYRRPVISPYSLADKVNRSMSSGIKLEAIVQYSRSELLSRTRAFYSSAMKPPRVEIRFPFFRHLNPGFFLAHFPIYSKKLVTIPQLRREKRALHKSFFSKKKSLGTNYDCNLG